MIEERPLLLSPFDEYGTPQWLFDQRDAVYGFTLDACASPENAKVQKYFTKAQDGLGQSWKNNKVFVHPPYSDLSRWMAKCLSEHITHNILIDCLVPNRSDTKWFHESVAGYAIIIPIEDRITFDGAFTEAPFASILVTYLPRIIKP